RTVCGEIALRALCLHAVHFCASDDQVDAGLARIGIERGFEIAAWDVERLGVRRAGEQQQCRDGCGVFEISVLHVSPSLLARCPRKTNAPQREMMVSVPRLRTFRCRTSCATSAKASTSLAWNVPTTVSAAAAEPSTTSFWRL